MSNERTDVDSAARIRACPDTAARMALARTEGFDFTPAEITAQAGELADDKPDAVAGGGDGRQRHGRVQKTVRRTA